MSSLLTFLGVNFLVVIIPGPSMLYTVSRTLDEGLRAGLASVFGLALGTAPHAVAVAAGLAAILSSSRLAFGALKYAGAAYLVFLGIQRIRNRNPADSDLSVGAAPRRGVLRESFTVGVLNPQSIVFFGALFPQFVDPTRGNAVGQVFILWFLAQATAVMVGTVYAFAAGSLRRGFLGGGRRVPAWDYVAGAVFVGLGVVLALSGSATGS